VLINEGPQRLRGRHYILQGFDDRHGGTHSTGPAGRRRGEYGAVADRAAIRAAAPVGNGGCPDDDNLPNRVARM
jgi:hypothetical protein